jgi:hypothetical protein
MGARLACGPRRAGRVSRDDGATPCFVLLSFSWAGADGVFRVSVPQTRRGSRSWTSRLADGAGRDATRSLHQEQGGGGVVRAQPASRAARAAASRLFKKEQSCNVHLRAHAPSPQPHAPSFLSCVFTTLAPPPQATPPRPTKPESPNRLPSSISALSLSLSLSLLRDHLRRTHARARAQRETTNRPRGGSHPRPRHPLLARENDEAMASMLDRMKAAVGMAPPPEPELPRTLPQQLLSQIDEATTLTWQQRAIGFGCSFGGGLLLAFMVRRRVPVGVGASVAAANPRPIPPPPPGRSHCRPRGRGLLRATTLAEDRERSTPAFPVLTARAPPSPHNKNPPPPPPHKKKKSRSSRCRRSTSAALRSCTASARS